MDIARELEAIDERTRRARQARREAERPALQASIRDALGGLQEGRQAAPVLNVSREPQGAFERIQGHPGHAAVALVRRTLDQYRIAGQLSCRYGGMRRTSGRGAYEIQEGLIKVIATLVGFDGLRRDVEVPVVVREGAMLPPSVLFYGTQPHVISQSALDDVVNVAHFGGAAVDRPQMFSPPGSREFMVERLNQLEGFGEGGGMFGHHASASKTAAAHCATCGEGERDEMGKCGRCGAFEKTAPDADPYLGD